jgi:hypothetical protein
MPLKKMLSTLIILVLMSACTPKEYTRQQSIFIVFKTPTFKHADLGFIYENDKEIKVEIYGVGQPLLSLEISQSSVCMSLLECMSKVRFNKMVLSENYPQSILENIFIGKSIFGGESLTKTSNGFTQSIRKTNKYNIKYSVLNNQIHFRDTMNNILIKVKRLK